jgi:Tfp pilus assembly protein PilF
MKQNAFGWLLYAVLVIGAAGAGVTGTLLWMGNRPASTPITPVVTPSTPPSANAVHEPPVTLTAGMTTGQAALTLGNWYFDHKAWPRAIEYYRGAIAQGEDNANVRTDLGSAYRFGGQPQKALEQYRLAQKQNPHHENSLFNQGGLYAFELKQPNKAVAAWRAYLKAFPRGQNAALARQLIARIEKQKTKQESKLKS